jgi:solute:Na+ symporter, SSS family
MMILGTLLAMGIEDIGPWVFFINAAMIAPALPLAWLRWFWSRFNVWGELFGLLISVPLSSFVWFGVEWEGDSRVWKPTLLLLGIGLVGSIVVALLTPAESPKTLRNFYLKVRPPGAWGAIRRQLAREGLIDLEQQRRELRWDLIASACGVVFCFTMVYAFFKSVLLQWQTAAALASVSVVSGAAFFSCWVKSYQTSEETDAVLNREMATTPSFELESPV